MLICCKFSKLFCLKTSYTTIATEFEFLIYDKYDKITCFTTNNPFKTKLKYFKSFFKLGRLCEKITVSNKLVKKYLNDNTEIYKSIIYSNNIEDMFKVVKEENKWKLCVRNVKM